MNEKTKQVVGELLKEFDQVNASSEKFRKELLAVRNSVGPEEAIKGFAAKGVSPEFLRLGLQRPWTPEEWIHQLSKLIKSNS